VVIIQFAGAVADNYLQGFSIFASVDHPSVTTKSDWIGAKCDYLVGYLVDANEF